MGDGGSEASPIPRIVFPSPGATWSCKRTLRGRGSGQGVGAEGIREEAVPHGASVIPMPRNTKMSTPLRYWTS